MPPLPPPRPAWATHRLTVRFGGAGDRPLAIVAGEIDQDCAEDLRHALESALGDGPDGPGGIDVDLRDVSFCDCAGLNALLRVRLHALDSGRTVRLRAVSGQVGRLLSLSGTESLFTAAA
ncbi:STAS domain-containing protein [Streptomyces sp. NPDC088354]|uniref:STAS domain-containing protein n=1 Tax=unclassified Streptomyces TaxID=2593676 RepID=UPI0029BF9745|nr:STAS domain-containing protein [Streptomyces sp. MI02-7b]MDX3072940.1 STAS domain-containing protein [Streptomyces sp. MI02-7b]